MLNNVIESNSVTFLESKYKHWIQGDEGRVKLLIYTFVSILPISLIRLDLLQITQKNKYQGVKNFTLMTRLLREVGCLLWEVGSLSFCTRLVLCQVRLNLHKIRRNWKIENLGKLGTTRSRSKPENIRSRCDLNLEKLDLHLNVNSAKLDPVFYIIDRRWVLVRSTEELFRPHKWREGGSV